MISKKQDGSSLPMKYPRLVVFPRNERAEVKVIQTQARPQASLTNRSEKMNPVSGQVQAPSRHNPRLGEHKACMAFSPGELVSLIHYDEPNQHPPRLHTASQEESLCSIDYSWEANYNIILMDYANCEGNQNGEDLVRTCLFADPVPCRLARPV